MLFSVRVLKQTISYYSKQVGKGAYYSSIITKIMPKITYAGIIYQGQIKMSSILLPVFLTSTYSLVESVTRPLHLNIVLLLP